MRSWLLSISVCLAFGPTPDARAQERIPSHCRSLAETTPGGEYLWRASLSDPVPSDTVRIRYIDHSMFAIQAGNVTAITDFNGFLGGTGFVPDVVTMNHAHSSHFTNFVNENIPNVFKGWGDFGEGIKHDLDLGPMRVRNVSTDIRMGSGVEENGNSVFIFEAAGLCIGHLGHLHHEPSEEQYAAIGRLDVVMAPVDGGFTVPRETMVRIVERFRSSVVVPMHWFSRSGLTAFLREMEESFAIVETGSPELLMSLDRLPAGPTIMVLEPQWIVDE